jgi:hypothetical protein
MNRFYQSELADSIDRNPTFSSIAQEVAHEREVSAMRWPYIYEVDGSIAGQATSPFVLTIEQGTDFKCEELTVSAFSYNGAVATSFPIANSGAVAWWAGRGLSVKITDTRSGRELTSGYVPLELIGTPGYGMNFQRPYGFRYFFYRNSKLIFDVRNRDLATRTHSFAFALKGWKILTPGT